MIRDYGREIMALDSSFQEHNRQSTHRMRHLAEHLTDEDLQRPMGEHWTIAVAFAHIAFWDARVLAILEASEEAGQPIIHPMDIVVNDLSLQLWLAIPPRQAVQIALETAERLDQRVETFSPALLEQIASMNIRFIRRDFHRTAHLDEIDAVLNKMGG
jgi:hypothetical protein